jgi:hypothetical protein
MEENLQILLSGNPQGSTKPLWSALCQEKIVPFFDAHQILFSTLEALYSRLTTKKGYQELSSSYQGTDPLPGCGTLEDAFTAVRAPMNRLFDYYKAFHDVNTDWSLRAANALHTNQQVLTNHRRYNEEDTHISDAELAGRCFDKFLESFTKLYDILNAIHPKYMKDIVDNAEQYTSALVGVLKTHQLQERLPAGRYIQSTQGLINGHESIEIWRENKRSPKSIREEIQEGSYQLLDSAKKIKQSEQNHVQFLENTLSSISQFIKNGNPVEELDQQRSFIYQFGKLFKHVRSIHFVAFDGENCEKLFEEADRFLENLWEQFVFPADIAPPNRAWIAANLAQNVLPLYKEISTPQLSYDTLKELLTFLDKNPVVHNPEQDPYLQSLPRQLQTIVEQVEEKCIDIPEWAARETTRVTQYTIFAVAEWLESLGIETASWYRPKRQQLGTENTLPEKYLNVEDVSAVLDVGPVEPAELPSVDLQAKQVPEEAIDPAETHIQRIIREYWEKQNQGK